MTSQNFPYDPENIFAKILRGELPCHKIWEDEKTFAFLDIMPRAEGHALILPKVPARTIIDCPQDILTAVILTTQRIAKVALVAFSADGITITQHNELAGGQEVPHLHFHLIPRRKNVALQHEQKPAEKVTLQAHAQKYLTLLR